MSSDTGDWVKPIPYVDAVTKPFWDATRRGAADLPGVPGLRAPPVLPPGRLHRLRRRRPSWATRPAPAPSTRSRSSASTAGPAFKDELPYVVAMIELDEGVRMMGNVTDVDPETVAIGDQVQVWFADAGERAHIPLWKPAD